MEELVRYDPHLVVGILGGSAGTTRDAFQMLADAQKYGAKVALYGRKINNAENQLAFIQFLRLIVDGVIGPVEAVKAYHAVLGKLGIAPKRPLDDDLTLQSAVDELRRDEDLASPSPAEPEPAKAEACGCHAPPRRRPGGPGRACHCHDPTPARDDRQADGRAIGKPSPTASPARSTAGPTSPGWTSPSAWPTIGTGSASAAEPMDRRAEDARTGVGSLLAPTGTPRGREDLTRAGSPRVRGVDLTVEDGELFVIVGPSGSGKSTLLRLVAGLETLDAGSICARRPADRRPPPATATWRWSSRTRCSTPTSTSSRTSPSGSGPGGSRGPRSSERVRETASVLGLADCLAEAPGTLSGGQRRRVALGRALVLRPSLFLLDEPFSGLDAPLRASTRSELADLKRELGATMVLVTHDQAEALALGDRVAVLDRGRVVQVGRPLDLYDRPASRFVARFLGQPPMNLLPCLVAREDDDLEIRIVDLDDLGPLVDPARPLPGPRARSDGVRRGSTSASAPSSCRPARRLCLVDVDPADRPVDGPEARADGPRDPGLPGPRPLELIARLPRTPIRVGDRVLVELDFGGASWFDGTTGERPDSRTPAGRWMRS